MSKLQIDKLVNPNIEVVWEDDKENFSKDKIVVIENYFKQKYNTNNVTIITKSKNDNYNLNSVDISYNITDFNYQKDLIGEYLNINDKEDLKERVIKLDDIVNNKISSMEEFNRKSIKYQVNRIEFSNFLSFGDNQVLDLNENKGLSVIESEPANFSGKTTLSVDLLLFLFFGETTKTKKYEEIFNRYRDKNSVSVVGYINILGDDYCIERKLTRKLTKKGTFKVETKLNFSKVLSDGTKENLNGEQRGETEKIIYDSIGTKEDFLSTIITTGSNLEDLIDSKPTARGKLFNRFLGLDVIKLKEESAKKIYDNFNKTLTSNTYDVAELKDENKNNKEDLKTINKEIEKLKDEIEVLEDRIKDGNEYKDSLLYSLHGDVNENIKNIDVERLTNNIKEKVYHIEELNNKISNLKLVEPKKEYDENTHDSIIDEINENKADIRYNNNKLTELNNKLNSFDGNVKCEYCKLQLKTMSFEDDLKKEISELSEKNLVMNKKLTDLNKKSEKFKELKVQHSEYEKNNLILAKLSLDIDKLNNDIKDIENKISEYNKNEQKIAHNKRTELKIQKSESKISELNLDLREKNRVLSVKNNDIHNINKSIDNNKNLIKKIEEELEKVKIFKLYLKIFGKNGISKLLLKRVLPNINNELNDLLDTTTTFDLDISLSDKDELEFIMTDRTTRKTKYLYSGSGYEKTVASIAIRSVLTKVSMLPKPNIIVFDEIFGKIANSNLEIVKNLFHKIENFFDNIFIITHNPVISNWGSNIIKVEKNENVSNILS